MSLRPIDLQVSITKANELAKPNEVGNERYMVQDAFKHEMQKTTDRHMSEVNKSDELDKLEEQKEHGKNEYEEDEKSKEEAEKRRKEELRRKAQEENEAYKRKVTNQGNLFDFEA